MKHLDETALREFLSENTEQQEAALEHFDICPECKRLLVAELLPSSHYETPLSGPEKQALFDAVIETVQSSCAPSLSPQKTVMWRGTVLGAAAGFALAASLLLFVMPIFNTMTKNRPSASFPQIREPGNTATVQTTLSLEESVLTVNGTRCQGSITLTSGMHYVSTGVDYDGSVQLGEHVSLIVTRNSSCKFAIKDKNKFTAALNGEIVGSVEHGRDVELEIAVTGGSYHVIGTIFRIKSDNRGSSISVTEGRVAFVSTDPGISPDTISAGMSRIFEISTTAPEKRSRAKRITAQPTSSPVVTLEDVEVSDSSMSADSADVLKTARMLILRKRAPQEAIDLLRPYLSQSTSSDLFYHLAWAYESARKPDSAVKYYEQLIAYGATDERKEAAYQKLYRNAVESGSREKQISLLQQWSKDLPFSDMPLYQLATLERERGNFAVAVAHYADYIQRYPSGQYSEESYRWAAQCYKELGYNDDYAKYAMRYRQKYPAGKWIKELQ